MWEILTCFLLTQPTPADQSPSTAIASAHADLAKLPAQTRLYTRYLSLHSIPEKDRPEAVRILAGHVQHLSHAADITRPGIVAGGGLLRINFHDYGWSPEIWERLNDPYFTIPSGKEAHPAPWLGDREQLAEVVAWTGSWVPVVSAEWFFNATATAEGGRHYYEFLAVKTVADVEKLIGFDRKQIESIRVELREAVSRSSVTRKARAIARWDAVTGPYWRTFDFKEIKDGADPREVFGKDIEKHRAGSEGYFVLANYFWGTYGADDKDVLVGAVPGTIATDTHAKGVYKEVQPNISCMRCHPDGGLQPIDGWVRNLLNPPVELAFKDPKIQRERKQQYARKLEPFIKGDQDKYREAVREATSDGDVLEVIDALLQSNFAATNNRLLGVLQEMRKAAEGWDTKTYRTKYVAFFEAYEDAEVDAAWAARRFGVTEKHLRESIASALQRKEKVSTIVANMLHEGARKQTIEVRRFEEKIPEIYRLVGYPK